MIVHTKGSVIELGPLVVTLDPEPVKATILAVGKTTYDIELRYKGVFLKKATVPKSSLEAA